MPRLAPLLLTLVLALPASGQVRPPGETRPDSAPDSARHRATALFPYGRSVTYRDILTETRRLRRRPEPALDSTAGVDPALGITGLVVDETASPPGRLFYETFFLRWRPPPGAELVTVTVGEQPLPGNGTAIVIRADGETIVQTRLPRRQEEVEALAGQAVSFVQRRLAVG